MNLSISHRQFRSWHSPSNMMEDHAAERVTEMGATGLRKVLGGTKRRLRSLWQYRHVPQADRIGFTCNICGQCNSMPRTALWREGESCLRCGSTVRWRSIIHCLSMELFGSSLMLPEFPIQRDISGAGLSDWTGYAERLKEKFDYLNTFYHCAPLLDIKNPDPKYHGKYDFLISSDVFEHVPPPIDSAFDGARKLLKPSGVMIFSVPYVGGSTIEHFPELHRFAIHGRGQNVSLVNETIDGRRQEFRDVTFHGGAGTTVEMRIFGRDSLLKNFADAGFDAIRQYSEEVPQFGILWPSYDPTAKRYPRPIYGLDTPPWSARSRCPEMQGRSGQGG